MVDEIQKPDFLKEIQALEILDKIKAGATVEYDHVTIKGDIDISELNLQKENGKFLVASKIQITNSRIEGKVTFQDAIIKGRVHIGSSQLNDEINFGNSQFNNDVYFNASFNSYSFLNNSQFNRSAIFIDCKFNKVAHFSDSQFLALGFIRSQFNDDAFLLGVTKIGSYN